MDYAVQYAEEGRRLAFRQPLDAVFFLTYGLFNEKPWIDDVLLSRPHVRISAAMLWIVYRVAPVRD